MLSNDFDTRISSLVLKYEPSEIRHILSEKILERQREQEQDYELIDIQDINRQDDINTLLEIMFNMLEKNPQNRSTPSQLLLSLKPLLN